MLDWLDDNKLHVLSADQWRHSLLTKVDIVPQDKTDPQVLLVKRHEIGTLVLLITGSRNTDSKWRMQWFY